MIFLASRRWLALESWVLTMGDMQRLSLGGRTGEEVADSVYRGLVAGKDKLVWKDEGDWDRDPQGADTGDVAEDVWEGLVAEMDVPEDWELWLTNGDWHLDPQEGECGKVAVDGLDSLDVGPGDMVEAGVLWLTTGDWLLDPQGGERGEVAVDVCGGLGEEKETAKGDLLFWFTPGDWHLALQGGEIGEAAAEVWEGLNPGMEEVLEVWPTIGDWHLEPQGEVVELADVWEGLNVEEVEETVDNLMFWLAIGDWHLVLLGYGTGEVTERTELEMLVEGLFVWRLEVQVPVAGPSGVLKRLVRLGVVVGVGVSQGISSDEGSLDVCWTIVKIILKNTHRKLQHNTYLTHYVMVQLC